MSEKKSGIFSGISRELFDQKNNSKYKRILPKGVNKQIIYEISKENGEPEWMLEKRLEGLKIFQEKTFPIWGPDLSQLKLNEICYFANAEQTGEKKNWEEVPKDIKNTFDRLGIPKAEKEMLAWVGAQYDSEVVYHNLKKSYELQGVIFKDMSVAVREHSDLVKKYFMKCVPAQDHIFAALHASVWSGGTFLYVPENVILSEPLQAYFRMNIESGGQFEHTLMILERWAQAHYIEGCSAPKYNRSSLHAGCVEIFVWKEAQMRYSSVENWSSDTYNLNTKRALVDEDGSIEWVWGNMGSGTTMLYPCSILHGDHAKSSHLSLVFANKDQFQDVGAKVIHIGAHTSSQVISKSLSKSGGISVYRGLVDIKKTAHYAVSTVDCDALMLDEFSRSDTLPDIQVKNTSATCAHEASAGKMNEAHLFYLQSRGINEEEAKTMLVNGFLSPIMKELPLEYASEMNVLIRMEMEGSIG